MVVLNLCRKLCLRVATFPCNVLYCVLCNPNMALERHMAPLAVRTGVGFCSEGLLFPGLSC